MVVTVGVIVMCKEKRQVRPIKVVTMVAAGARTDEGVRLHPRLGYKVGEGLDLLILRLEGA